VYYYLTGLQGEVLCEIEKFGQGKTYYVYLNGKKLCRVRGSNKYFYHNDYLGSAKAMTDNSGTKIYSWLGYPFGQQYSMTGGAYNNYRFTGKEYDATTGLYYFGARYYMPEIGRFITADAAGKFEKKDPKTINLYSYYKDNPTRYVDPTGKWRTMSENGVMIAYREPPEDALARSGLSFIPGGEIADCFIRQAQGDVTLTRTDWILAAIDIALPIASEVAKAPLVRQVIKGVNQGMNAYAVYEAASDYQKAKELDPEIFARYSAKTGIKEEKLGIVSGKYKIILRNEMDRKTLEDISGQVYKKYMKADETMKPGSSDYYWRRGVQY
jgi:RHS repeat-associated protein